MHVRVAGVSEDHSAHAVLVERRPHSAHVASEVLRRDSSVLDELHRFERGIQLVENRTRSVTKLPYLVLIGGS